MQAAVDLTLGLKGRYDEAIDLGIPGSFNVKPRQLGNNTYLDLPLQRGEATVLRLVGPALPANDTESLRSEIRRLAHLAQSDIMGIPTLSRDALAAHRTRLLGRGPLRHFEAVQEGRVIVKASFHENLQLEVSDAERQTLNHPERIFGTARIEAGSLVLDAPGSAVAYTGDGFQQTQFGGSLGGVIGRPFTVQLDFKAEDPSSVGTIFDIWYHYTGHFRIRIVEGGCLQVRQRLRWYNHSPEVEMTSPPSAVNDGRWHHITVMAPNVADESVGLEILLDGKPICRQTDPTTHGNYTVSDSRRPGQMRGRPLVNGKVMQWGIGAHLDRVTGSSYSYISPQRLDTPRGRYRNLLITEGVQLSATTQRQ